MLDRIEAFSFDDEEAVFPFAARLARENDWSPTYTERVIEEYRRFMFLAVVAGHPVTPSDQVDQVWHLHLLYTRSYWDRFCADVLGKRVHHGPTKGGPEEGHKFEQWYDTTLDSYRSIFGAPPPDIWPLAAIRFGDDLHYVRVNTKQNCVIPRPRFRVWLWTGVIAVIFVQLAQLSPISQHTPGWLPMGLAIVGAIVAIAVTPLHRKRQSAAEGTPPMSVRRVAIRTFAEPTAV